MQRVQNTLACIVSQSPEVRSARHQSFLALHQRFCQLWSHTTDATPVGVSHAGSVLAFRKAVRPLFQPSAIVFSSILGPPSGYWTVLFYNFIAWFGDFPHFLVVFFKIKACLNVSFIINHFLKTNYTKTLHVQCNPDPLHTSPRTRKSYILYIYCILNIHTVVIYINNMPTGLYFPFNFKLLMCMDSVNIRKYQHQMG